MPLKCWFKRCVGAEMTLDKGVIGRTVMAVVACVALVLVVELIVLLWVGVRDDIAPSDVGIVLGSSITAGGEPSPRLQARLDRTGELWQAGVFPAVIVSGGVEPEGWDEAAIMARYLQQRWHVPASAILLDATGNTTHDTACHSAALMRQHGYRSALVVSQHFHIARSRDALQQAGIDDVHHAHAYFFERRDIYSTVREMVAWPLYRWRHADGCASSD